ncbi:MAG: hypothetical protein KJT03_09595, partial [Verrucomicrobiae bacterium]|nr:hypothetical protein [Verrucomicrobiae bacterium]
RLEKELRGLDNLPGTSTGSSVLFEEPVQARGFPIEMINDRQKQLLQNETTGVKTILLIRVGFPNKPGNPDYRETIDSQLNLEASNHLLAYSYGQTSLVATISETIHEVSRNSWEYASESDEDTIDEDDLFDEAVSAYRADVNDVDPFEDYDIVGLAFPRINEVSWGGLATVGGAKSRLWLNGVVGIDTIVHELGHNFGLLHANFWNYTYTNDESTNPVDPTGESIEYGDNLDVMGSAAPLHGHFNMASKQFLGWMKPIQVRTIVQSSENGITRVFQFDHKDAPSSNTQAIQIRKGNNEYYWVGLRKSEFGHSTFNPYILWEREEGASRNQTWLIDAYPSRLWDDPFDFNPFGKTFSDNFAGVHITPIAMGGMAPQYYVDVGVYLGDTSSNTPPSLILEAPTKLNARKPIQLRAFGNDPDGDELAFSWDLRDFRLHPNSPEIETEFIVGGIHEISVTACDLKGGSIKETVQIEVEDPLERWSSRESNTENHIFTVAVNDDCVVAGGEGVILRSQSGVKWTNQSPAEFSNITINDICWAGSRFVAVGHRETRGTLGGRYYAAVIFRSSDGFNWSKVLELEGLSYTLDRFLSVSSNLDGSLVIAAGDRGFVFKSVNGGSWQQVDLGFEETVHLSGIAFGNGYFVLAGNRDYTLQDLDYRYLFRTEDGANWESLVKESGVRNYYEINKLVFLNGRFFLIGDDSTHYISENSGKTWHEFGGEEYLNIHSLAFNNEVYCGIGPFGHNQSNLGPISVDGNYWRYMSKGPALYGYDIAFFKNSFIAVGDEGQIWQSTANLTAFEPWIDEFFRGDASDVSANPDGDWASNLFEWGLGSLPNDSKSAPEFPKLRISPDGYLIVSVPRFSKVVGAEFVLDWSLNLESWESLATAVLVDNEHLLELTSVNPIAAPTSFYRIRILEK